MCANFSCTCIFVNFHNVYVSGGKKCKFLGKFCVHNVWCLVDLKWVFVHWVVFADDFPCSILTWSYWKLPLTLYWICNEEPKYKKVAYCFFSKQSIYTKTKNRKNIKQCYTRYILDLNRGNAKVKIIIK